MDGISKVASHVLSRNPEFTRIEMGSSNSSHKPADGIDKSFSQTLNDAIHKVDELQKVADIKMQELSTGKNTNVAEVMLATEKADLALKLMVQVRNKVIDAYNEVMKMQV